MKTEVVMPQMGESIAEGTIVRWLKNVGDAVDRDEPLFEISTDKVDAEIPSPTAGVLVAIHVPAGATALVHAVVAVIQDSSAVCGPAPGPVEAGPYGKTGAATGLRASRVDAQEAGPYDRTNDSGPRDGAIDAARRHRVSPVARRIAQDRHVDLRQVSGSGEAGRITRQDVLRHLEGAGAPMAQAASGASPLARRSESPTPPPPHGAAVPMTSMRRAIAEHMIASRRTSAHVHSVFQVDCSRVETLRQARKAEYEAAGARLSILPFVVKAAAGALRAWPVLNASLDGDRIVYHGDVHVGIAVALENGLIVPVIRNADRRTLMELSLAIADLAGRARARRLTPEEVTGGTFTVTSPGNFGGTFATPIINQPQVAILEIGTVEKRVVVVNDALAVRPMMHLTLGFDHRLIDGTVADQFLSSVRHALETWSEDRT